MTCNRITPAITNQVARRNRSARPWRISRGAVMQGDMAAITGGFGADRDLIKRELLDALQRHGHEGLRGTLCQTILRHPVTDCGHACTVFFLTGVGGECGGWCRQSKLAAKEEQHTEHA